MTKHRRTRRRRSQKGGFLEYFGFGSSEPADPNAPGLLSKMTNWGSSALDKTKEVGNSVESGLGNFGRQASEGLSSLNVFGSSENNVPPVAVASSTVPPDTGSYSSTSAPISVPAGGRRRRRATSMKGGKGGLGLTYYATPVSGLKVAEPNLWQFYAKGTNQYSIKGGSRKRRTRKSRRTRRNKRC